MAVEWSEQTQKCQAEFERWTRKETELADARSHKLAELAALQAKEGELFAAADDYSAASLATIRKTSGISELEGDLDALDRALRGVPKLIEDCREKLRRSQRRDKAAALEALERQQRALDREMVKLLRGLKKFLPESARIAAEANDWSTACGSRDFHGFVFPASPLTSVAALLLYIKSTYYGDLEDNGR